MSETLQIFQIGDLIQTKNDKSKQLQSNDYQHNGVLPVVDQGAKPVCGYTNDLSKRYDKGLPVIIFGDHTLHTKFIDFTFAIGADGTQVIAPKNRGCDTKYLYYLISRAANLIGSEGYKRHFKILKEFDIEYIESLPVQQKIAAILSSVDDVIDKTRAQIDKLKDLKTGMMQELLTKGIGHTEFKDSPVGRIPVGWDVVPIDSIVSKVVDNRGKTPPLSREGIELLEINTISKDRVNPDCRKVRKFVSQETYNSWFRAGHPKGGDILIPTVGTIGACSLVEQDRGCIAQNIIALRLCKSIDPHFAYYILSSEPTVRQIESILMNAVQPSLRVPHFLMLKIALPSLSEQKIISASLLSIDKRLERLSGKIESLNLMKKALMQDLLTGKVRVNVEQKESAAA